jgi:hypothetical protein
VKLIRRKYISISEVISLSYSYKKILLRFSDRNLTSNRC